MRSRFGRGVFAFAARAFFNEGSPAPATATATDAGAVPLAAAPATPAPAAAPAPAVTATSTAGGEPGWLPQRLEQARTTERNRILQELGVTDLGAARNAIQASQQLPEVRTQAEQMRTTIVEHAARQMAVLTPEQQALIKELPGVGEDPAAQLKAIGAMQKHAGWSQPLLSVSQQQQQAATAAAATAAAAGSTATAPVPGTPAALVVAPATTSPPPSAPAGGTPPASPDWRSEYNSARERNPFEAAKIAAAHPEIFGPVK